MADVKIVDIDNVQWNMKDQEARNKNTEQDEKITNLIAEIGEIKNNYQRFYYDANTDKNVLQERIDAMIYCYNNSKSGVATIRYSGGYYHNVILPSVSLNLRPLFVEIDYYGNINIIQIENNQSYFIVKTI